MAAESTPSLPIPGLDGGVSADQNARTDSHTLSNGITSGSQDSEGYVSGSQTVDGQSSTAVGEVRHGRAVHSTRRIRTSRLLCRRARPNYNRRYLCLNRK